MSIESNSLGVNMKVEELLREKLPPPWNYGVTRDGRVFFVKYVIPYLFSLIQKLCNILFL